MAEAARNPAGNSFANTVRRVEWLTLAIGLTAAALAPVWFSGRTAVGVAVGTVLAFLNSRWMAEGIDVLAQRSTQQQGAGKPQVSRWVYARFLLRYALIGLVTYVIFIFLEVPVVSVLAGLLALGAAALVHAIFEASRSR